MSRDRETQAAGSSSAATDQAGARKASHEELTLRAKGADWPFSGLDAAEDELDQLRHSRVTKLAGRERPRRDEEPSEEQK